MSSAISRTRLYEKFHSCVLHLRRKSGLQTCDSGDGLQRRFFVPSGPRETPECPAGEPHMQNDSGRERDCRGRSSISSSEDVLHAREYS